MASVNPHTRELVFKLVFYGPGLGGKTTTLQYIYAATKPEHRGKMVSLATPTDRTLYFDFLPIRVPRVRGMAVRLQLFTVPGQVYYAATRKLVLSGADAVVFVADSQNGRMELNQESLDDLHANLAEHQRALEEVPHTFHWNKRDLQDLVPIDELERRFNKYGVPSLGTVATKGEGVFEGLERITRLVLKSYENDPKVRIEAEPSDEEGIAQALRDMEAGASPRPSAPRSGSQPDSEEPSFESPTKVSGAVLDEMAASLGGKPAASSFSSPSSAGRSPNPPEVKERDSKEPPPKDPRGSGAHQKFTFPEPPGPTPASVPPESRPVFTLSELWPESDRESVRQAEQMVAARDAVNAILACDVLVTRVLASAAGLVGTLDAPRDPAVVAMMLGLEGTRYLHFRTLVRGARHREAVSMKDALECFAFAIEARRARELLRR